MPEIHQSTVTVPNQPGGPVDVRLTHRGEGRPVLLLHGGAGPASVAGFADLLATQSQAQVWTPTHPGFDGTERPAGLDTIRGLASVYVGLLEDFGLSDVTVIGNSIGGWIAAEMALLDDDRVSGYVFVDAVGIEVTGHPVADFFALTFPEIAALSYFNDNRFRIDPSALPPAAQALMAGNRATLATYAGTMVDPSLRERLAAIETPALVVWGDSDGIADLAYGRAFADAIPNAHFEVMKDTGHLPQIESPDLLVGLINTFLGFAESADKAHEA